MGRVSSQRIALSVKAFDTPLVQLLSALDNPRGLLDATSFPIRSRINGHRPMECLATGGSGGFCRGDGRFVNSKLLASLLRSIGHETFAEYYRELSDLSLSRADLIECLLTDSRNAGKGRNGGEYTRGTCGSKVSHGRRIIRAGRGVDALRLIADSKNDRAKVYALAQLRAMEE